MASAAVDVDGSRSPPDEEDEGPKRKRRRKIWSCLECRRRKLLCDRALPACTRCTKTGRVDECLYLHEDNAPGAGSRNDVQHHQEPSRLPFDQLENGAIRDSLLQQATRIKTLEQMILHQQAPVNLPPLTPQSPNPEHGYLHSNGRQGLAGEVLNLRGGSFRTKYNGGTHSNSLVSLIPGLLPFAKEAFDTSGRVDDLRHQASDANLRPIISYAMSHWPRNDEDIRALLPSRTRADILVQQYLDNYESMYHILHMPDFRRDYEQLWLNIREADMLFVVLVLLVIAIGLCLTVDKAITARDEATKIIQCCDAWLQATIHKYCTALDFQIGFLSLFARLLNKRRYKRTWINAGKVLREFASAGLIRDADDLKEETTLLEKELRRRLWVAVAEFELQAAFEHGMPAIAWPQQCDARPPGNITDDDCPYTTVPRERREFTSSSYLAVAGESLQLRHQINSMLNDFHHPYSFEETKALTEKIQRHLASIPQWEEKDARIPKASLTINLSQYLLALHERQARHAKTDFERNIARMMMFDSAVRMSNAHEAILGSGSYAIELLWEDNVRTALSACYIYASADPTKGCLMNELAIDHARQLVEDSVFRMRGKMDRFTSDHRQLWIIIAAQSFVKSLAVPSEKKRFMQEAVEDFNLVLQKAVVSQNTLAAATTGTRKGQNERIERQPPSKVANAIGTIDQSQPFEYQVQAFEEIDFWTLDEWVQEPWAAQSGRPDTGFAFDDL